MSEEDVSPEARRFLAEHIESVLELELLLLVAATPQRAWSAAEVARELRVDASWAALHLSGLCARGVLQCEPGPDGPYRFAPRTPETAAAVEDLAAAYASRRVTVISLIFSKPIDKLRSFADAFRIRREEDHG